MDGIGVMRLAGNIFKQTGIYFSVIKKYLKYLTIVYAVQIRIQLFLHKNFFFFFGVFGFSPKATKPIEASWHFIAPKSIQTFNLFNENLSLRVDSRRWW